MTPLVDVAFLLLTFFMFATTASFPNVMEIAMPEANITVPVSPANLLTLYVGGDGALFYTTGLDPRMRPLPAPELKAFVVARNAEHGNGLITVLKVDPSARYERLIGVLDELNIAEADLTDGYAARGMKRERRFTIAAMTREEREMMTGMSPSPAGR
jgi:biopolymer transport protein ExbD